jgi:hypothetical protein
MGRGHRNTQLKPAPVRENAPELATINSGQAIGEIFYPTGVPAKRT